jgi:hypothetical protein
MINSRVGDFNTGRPVVMAHQSPFRKLYVQVLIGIAS